MVASRDIGPPVAVGLRPDAVLPEWRDAARRLLAAEVPPEAVAWGGAGAALPAAPAEPGARVPRAFVELAERALRHPDAGRFALLYRLLWRLTHGQPGLLHLASDPEVARAEALAREATQRGAPGIVEGAMPDSRSSQARLDVQRPAPPLPAATAALPLREREAALAALREEVLRDRETPLAAHATQAVFGEGPLDPPLMMVGEQPGDEEDIAGRPFVGPAGRLLDRALERAGVARPQAWVTNAVKHFKYEQRGKKRIHQKPDAGDIAHYRPFLMREIELVRPRLILALGATAAQSLLGGRPTISRLRGAGQRMREGCPVRVTVHPSFLLRLPDEAAREREYALFVADLKAAAHEAA